MSAAASDVVAIGTSAGALDALSVVLGALPEAYPRPLLVVVHLPPDTRSLMAELLQARCRIDVREAEDKEPIRPGTAYLAPPNYHLLVERNGCLSLSGDEAVHYSRPSIDVLFESAADVYGERLTGVVLTGANSDGALGLRAICEAGGSALVQQPGEAFAEAMPRAALAACPTALPLSLQQIALHLRDMP